MRIRKETNGMLVNGRMIVFIMMERGSNEFLLQRHLFAHNAEKMEGLLRGSEGIVNKSMMK